MHLSAGFFPSSYGVAASPTKSTELHLFFSWPEGKGFCISDLIVSAMCHHCPYTPPMQFYQ